MRERRLFPLARSGFSSSPESWRFVSTAAEVRASFRTLPRSFSASGWNGRHSSVVEHKETLRGAAVVEGDLVSSYGQITRQWLRMATFWDDATWMKCRQWLRVLAYVSGLINQELLLQVEYLTAENRILRAHLRNRLRLTRDERSSLGEIGKRVGRKGLEKVASVARPETVLGWFRKLVAQKFDGSKHRSYPGRPKIGREIEKLIVEMARENSGWGYDRIGGALANLGHKVSDQTVGNVLRRHGIAPAPKRSQTTAWKEFIASHMAVTAGIDFFTAEVLTWRGLVTYYVLFVIELETRRVTLAGITRHPTQEWMEQVARNLTDFESGSLRNPAICCTTAIRNSVPAFGPFSRTEAFTRSAFLPALRISMRSPSDGSDLSNRSVCRSSSCSANPRFEELWFNTSNTIMRSGIIRAKTTCCYSPPRVRRVVWERS
jgi:hypothetical protein